MPPPEKVPHNGAKRGHNQMNFPVVEAESYIKREKQMQVNKQWLMWNPQKIEFENKSEHDEK